MPANPCNSHGGQDFFLFHRGFLATANSFRVGSFGYPATGTWDGTVALPAGNDVDHRNRNVNGIPFAKPSYFTAAGGTREAACFSGATMLGHFQTAKELADQMEAGWHGRGHVRVGGSRPGPVGDMSGFGTSPKDPIFFRWHNAIDGVYGTWLTTPRVARPSGPAEVAALAVILATVLILYLVRRVRLRQAGA